MINYECEKCGDHFEIERVEADNTEHYQHGMCYGCFMKDIGEYDTSREER